MLQLKVVWFPVKKIFITGFIILLPQVVALSAWALPTCDFIQVQCLPSIKEMQLKVHPQDCTKAWWYTADQLAIYEQDHIYRPYEHNKAYEEKGDSYNNHPEKPRHFICNMGKNTIELELGATRPDPEDNDCQSSYGYLPYTKWKLNGQEVSEKLYFNNYGYCLKGAPKGVNHIYQTVVKPDSDKQLQLVVQDGFEHKIYVTYMHFGTLERPILLKAFQAPKPIESP